MLLYFRSQFKCGVSTNISYLNQEAFKSVLNDGNGAVFLRVILIKMFKAEFCCIFVNEILSVVCYITIVYTIIGLGNNWFGQFHGPPLKGTEWCIEW